MRLLASLRFESRTELALPSAEVADDLFSVLRVRETRTSSGILKGRRMCPQIQTSVNVGRNRRLDCVSQSSGDCIVFIFTGLRYHSVPSATSSLSTCELLVQRNFTFSRVHNRRTLRPPHTAFGLHWPHTHSRSRSLFLAEYGRSAVQVVSHVALGDLSWQIQNL